LLLTPWSELATISLIEFVGEIVFEVIYDLVIALTYYKISVMYSKIQKKETRKIKGLIFDGRIMNS
jgi:hypothetical protein